MKFAAAAIAVMIACPLPAAARQFPFTPSMQVDCLMRAIPEAARISAVHAFIEIDGAARLEMTPAITAALDSCGKTHSWSSEQRNMAYDAMMYKTRMDELLYGRFTEQDLRAVRLVSDQLLYVDKKPLVASDWRTDAALNAYVRSEFAERGMTDAETQRHASELIWALHNHIALLDRWEARWPTPPLVRPPPPPPPRPRTPAPPG